MALFRPHQGIFNPTKSIIQDGAGGIKPSRSALAETPLESKKRQLLELLSYTFKGEMLPLPAKFISPKNTGTDVAIDFFQDPLLNRLNRAEGDISLWLLRPEQFAGKKDAAYAELQALESFYASLPYGGMKGKEECYPLFAIRDMLPGLHNHLDQICQCGAKTNAEIEKHMEPFRVAKLEIMEIHDIYCEGMRRISKGIPSSSWEGDAAIPAFDADFSAMKKPADEQKTPGELKEEANGLARFYFHSMGGVLRAIWGFQELLQRNICNHEEASRDILPWLESIEGRYGSIPFDELRGNAAYYPLFIVKTMLPSLRSAAEACIRGEKDENQITRLRLICCTIKSLGDIYRKKFNSTCEEINRLEGNDDFKIQIPPGMTGVQFPLMNGVG